MTVATLLRADRRVGGDYEHDEWQSPDSTRIAAVISRMDQWNHTETTLRGADWWFALIGGGSEAYIVSIENQMTGLRFDLVDPEGSEEESIDIVAGGQKGRYPPRLVVGQEEAVRAALYFAETGEPDPALHWIEEHSA